MPRLILVIVFIFLNLPISALALNCETVVNRPGTRLMKCGRLHVLRLEGSPEERQRNHGALLGKELSRAPLEYFAQKIFDPLRKMPGFVQWSAEKLINLWVRVLHSATPANLAKEVDAFADGAKMNRVDVRRAMSVPDIAAFLVKWSANSMLEWIPTAGCTSIAKRFSSGGFVYGRNLDFAGALIWDQHPLLTIHIPKLGTSELKHAAIGADGAGFAGITGFNEAGITFAVHQNYSKVAKTGGLPMFLIGDVVLRNARTIEDAITALKELRPSPLWTFVVTDLKTGRAVAVETAMEGFAVREMTTDRFAQTNHLQSSVFAPREHISIGTKYNSKYRFDLALKKLDAIKSSEEAKALEKFAAILSYQADPNGNLSGYHDVLKAHTIQTVLLQQQGGRTKLLLSVDDAPTASGAFAQLALQDLWSFTESLSYKLITPTHFSKQVRGKQKAISRAFAKYFDDHDRQGAILELANHTSLDAKLFTSVAQYEDHNYEKAASVAHDAYANPRFLSEPAQIRESLKRVELLALWHAGRRSEAKREAEQVLAQNKPLRPGLHNLAKALVKSNSPGRSRSKITFEFFSGDLGGITEP